MIFKDESGRLSDAQQLAFEDIWHWGPGADELYARLTSTDHHHGTISEGVGMMLSALRSAIDENPMMAYIVQMTARLLELHRVLKPTGILCLHCDSTASHYLRILLDSIFGPQRLVNEIVWQRTSAHSDSGQGSRHFGRVADYILVYSKGQNYTWHQEYRPHDDDYVRVHYPYTDPKTRRRYGLWDMTGPGGKAKGNPYYDVLGVSKYWRYSHNKMQEKLESGRVVQPSPGAVPREVRYLDESPGVPLTSIWTDIAPLNSQAKERVGFPTQKPVGLLKRLIGAFSNPGDLILDPFCGCGTALVAAQQTERRWIGIDITYLAIAVMKARLRNECSLETVDLEGRPREVEAARQLVESRDGPYKFQWWLLAEIGAMPVGAVRRKGADRGIDGVITFLDVNGKMEKVLVSVKSGRINSGMIRDLRGTVERERAAIGVFMTLEESTAEMRREAGIAGLYHSELRNRDFRRIQIVSVRQLLVEGLRPHIPPLVLTGGQQEGISTTERTPHLRVKEVS
jgi:DNA modification methylase